MIYNLYHFIINGFILIFNRSHHKEEGNVGMDLQSKLPTSLENNGFDEEDQDH